MAGMTGADVVCRFVVRMPLFMSQLAIAGGLLKLGTGCLNKVEDGLEETGVAGVITAGDNDPDAAMSIALVIEGELDFGSDVKRPFGQETDAFGRPLDMLLNEIDGVRKTNCNALALISPCFGSDRHNQHL